MITISLCMIVKNEEATLERCLHSVKNAVEEIIIVDTGSTDRTKELAAKFTDHIYDFEWIDDFSAARNFAYDKATMDYIMWLDADDILRPEDNEKLLALKETLTSLVDVVMMRYNTGFDQEGHVTFSCYRERLSKRSRNFKWKEPVHEYLATWGNTINSEVCITHAKIQAGDNNRNIRIYEERLKKQELLSPRGMYYYARELKDHGRFADAAKWFQRFLDTKAGWVEDNITACSELARCYQLEKKPEEELASLMRSFSFDTPRAELCCQIGYYFQEQKKYKAALFWFDLVFQLEQPKESWGFCHHDSWGYIPALECVVCCDKLGDYEKAAAYNEKAGGYKADSAAVQFNRTYFANRK